MHAINTILHYAMLRFVRRSARHKLRRQMLVHAELNNPPVPLPGLHTARDCDHILFQEKLVLPTHDPHKHAPMLGRSELPVTDQSMPVARLPELLILTPSTPNAVATYEYDHIVVRSLRST